MSNNPPSWPILYSKIHEQHTQSQPQPRPQPEHRVNSLYTYGNDMASALSNGEDMESFDVTTSSMPPPSGSILNPAAKAFPTPTARPESTSTTNTFMTEAFASVEQAKSLGKAPFDRIHLGQAPSSTSGTSSQGRFHLLPSGPVPMPAFGQFPPRPDADVMASSMYHAFGPHDSGFPRHNFLPALNNTLTNSQSSSTDAAGITANSKTVGNSAHTQQNIMPILWDPALGGKEARGIRSGTQVTSRPFVNFLLTDGDPFYSEPPALANPLANTHSSAVVAWGNMQQNSHHAIGGSMKQSAQGAPAMNVQPSQNVATGRLPRAATISHGSMLRAPITAQAHQQYSIGGIASTDPRLSKANMIASGSYTPHHNVHKRFSSAPSAVTKARELVLAIKQGYTESPYDQSPAPKSPKMRPTNPSFTPVRFTSDKARQASLSLNDETFEAKQYPARYTYLFSGYKPLPDWFTQVQLGNYQPVLAEAFEALPFAELYRMTGPSTAGVIKITDFPYATTKAEIIAFIGRNAQILSQPIGSPYFAIHIILERESGKTNECYVEIETPDDAAWIVRQFKKRSDNGRMPKIGDRDVKVEFSSQEALMDALFPKAKNIRWLGARPMVIVDPMQYYEHLLLAGFQGFFSTEEYYHLVKYGDVPERNPFINRSPTRAYECVISIIHKYPWYEPQLITLEERRRIYDATRILMKALVTWLLTNGNRRLDPREQSPGLLQELVVAALTCPGFTERQKASLVEMLVQNSFGNMAVSNNVNIPMGGNHELSAFWPFVTISKAPGVDMDVVKYYASLFRDATVGTEASLYDATAARALGYDSKPMGVPQVRFGAHAEKLTLEQAARLEMNAIQEMLEDVLPYAHYAPDDDVDEAAAAAAGFSADNVPAIPPA